MRKAASAGTRASIAGMLFEPGYSLRGGRLAAERTAASVASFEIDGRRRQALSVGSSEHFALPRLRREPPVTDVGVYLGWFGGATGLVRYAAGLAELLGRSKSVRGVVDRQARRIQGSRSGPAAGPGLRSDVVAEAADAEGRHLVTVRLIGGDPYSFTAGMLAWAASTAAAQGVRPAGAIGPAEAFGLASLESACAAAGFRRA
jgi:hypothetical protein